jgi:hypothetical protein
MGLNLSNRQIAQDLALETGDVQHVTRQLRQGVVARKPPVKLDGVGLLNTDISKRSTKHEHEQLQTQTPDAKG